MSTRQLVGLAILMIGQVSLAGPPDKALIPDAACTQQIPDTQGAPDTILQIQPEKRVRDIATLKKGLFTWKAQEIPPAFWAQYDRDIGLRNATVRVAFHPNWGMTAESLVPVLKRLKDSGAEPLICLWGIPRELASKDDDRLAGGDPGWRRWATLPPRDEKAWKALVASAIREWNTHHKLGIRFVEIGNEPDGTNFWSGDLKQYLQLYKATAEAIRQADPEMRVGGPATSGWLGRIGGDAVDPKTGEPRPKESLVHDLIAWCGRERVPLDFVSWHYAGPGRSERELRPVETTRGWLRTAGFDPALPVIIDEWAIALPSAESPDTNCDDEIGAAYAAALFVSMAEAGVDRQCVATIMDEPSSDPKKPVTDLRGHFYGIMTQLGIAKPVYNIFRMQALLGDDMVAVKHEDGLEALYALATRNGDSIAVMIAHYAHPFKGSSAAVEMFGLLRKAGLTADDMKRISERLKANRAENAFRKLMETGRGDAAKLPLEEGDRAKVKALAEAYRKRVEAAAKDLAVRVEAPFEGKYVATEYLVDDCHANAFAVRSEVRAKLVQLRTDVLEEAASRLEKKGLDGVALRGLFAVAHDSARAAPLLRKFTEAEQKLIAAETVSLEQNLWDKTAEEINRRPDVSLTPAGTCRGDGPIRKDIRMRQDSVRLLIFEKAAK